MLVSVNKLSKAFSCFYSDKAILIINYGTAAIQILIFFALFRVYFPSFTRSAALRDAKALFQFSNLNLIKQTKTGC
jgi:hypothetical protein